MAPHHKQYKNENKGEKRMSYKQLVRSVGHINTHMVGEYVTG